jgi:lipoate-protein ligase A
MKYIETDWPVPYYNMALESMLMEEPEFDSDYLFFYIHDPSVIIGKHQIALQETNQDFIREKGVYVARRITGGGAVYHDRGNLNYSFVFSRRGSGIDFASYTKPVLDALKSLGVDALLSGRNDILIDGKKFSGTAQYANKDKMLSHGTLMFDLNIENMANALNVDNLKIESKAITSIKSRVANLKDYVAGGIDILEFKRLLLERFSRQLDIQKLALTDEQLRRIDASVKEKFSTWEHNYGTAPDYSVVKRKKYPSGIVQASMLVSDGIIEQIKFSGDFFVNVPIERLEEMLVGTPLNESAIASLAQAGDVIAGFGPAELADLLLY